MQARVEEDRAAQTLYRIGSSAVWHAGQAFTIRTQTGDREDMRWATDLAEYYDKLRAIDHDMFHRLVDRSTEGEFGLMPDLEWLSTASLDAAVARLGEVAAIQTLDFRQIVHPVQMQKPA